MATSSILPNMQAATAPMSLPGGSTPPPVVPTQMASAVAPVMKGLGTLDNPTSTLAQPKDMPAYTPAPFGKVVNPGAPAAPPTPYSLSAVPQFLKDNLEMNKVQMAPMVPGTVNAEATGYVTNDNPYLVHTTSPEVGQSVLNHELTHTLQDVSGAKFADGNDYNYGGVAGLQNALASGKKITDFNPEQVSRMVEDHTTRVNQLKQWSKLGVLQPEDVAAFKKWKSAVGPYISQLAALKSGKKYDPITDQPGMVADLPEFSNEQIAVPHQSAF